MKIKISKFGKLLISRPAGREAFLAACAYTFNNNDTEFILDFSDVDVLSPSWADEFMGGIKNKFKNIVLKYENTTNKSVEETLKFINPKE